MTQEQIDRTNYYLDLAAQAVREAIENGTLKDGGPRYPTFIHPDEPGYPAQ